MKICVVIPIYNEAEAIGGIVKSVRIKGFDCVVIDDGSDDRGGAIAKEKGAVVITHDKRSGKGCSLRDGFNYVLAHDYDGVIAMDGDGQHDSADIEGFVKKAGEDPDSVITGSRMANPKGMPLVRLIVNRTMSAMISAVCHQRVPDTQCGFRYIGRRLLKEIKLSCSDFEIESEVLIEASRKGFKIYSVPIKTIYNNEISKINPFVDTIRFFVYIIRQAWNIKS